MSKPSPARYRTTNWSSYTASLRRRGSLLIWLDKEMAWVAPPEGKPGRPAVFSDAAIQFCLTIKVLFKLPLRQTTGMVASLLKMANLDWDVPDYTTLCRRQKTLAVHIPYLNANVREFEVLRWHGDIGTISVRADDGPWTTVPASDEMWIGKTDTDLRIWLQERALENEDEKAARRDFINDVTQEAYRLKRLLGLISLPKTPEELAKAVERFKRHADTAERRHAAGAYRTLLAGLEDHDESDDFQSNSIASTASNDAVMAEDSYETNTME